MTVLAPEQFIAAAPISPELVLVSPPEVATFARSLLPFPPALPASRPRSAEVVAEPGYLELAVVWLVCIALALGPLLFILVARP